MPLNPYRRSPTWEKITQLIAERNRKMEEVRRLYCEVREIDRLVSQLRGDLKPKQQSDQNSDQDRGAA
ncbi:MAG: hypothetical protein JWN45_3372 [Acidobacteriaceae bacterium]|nr:hypothetical protein [Acidobacteriaceae bacterium]